MLVMFSKHTKHIYILNGLSSIWNKNKVSSVLADTSGLPLAYEILESEL